MFALEFLRAPVWQGLTWTLLHFLWEGLAVAVVLMLLLRLCGVRRSRIRYLLCLGGMATMVLCPIVTFLVLAGDTAWNAADWGAGQARSTPIAEAAVDLGPSLPLETTMDTLAAPHTVALPPVVTANESRLWDRLAEYGRDAQPYLLTAWVLGVVCLSVRLLLGVVAARWLRRAREAIPPPLADSVARLSRAMGLRSAARVCMSSRIREAMLVGILRPMVLLPAAWATEMTPEILEAIIAHELAHIRRWDLWATLFQRLVETLLFYHPVVWWISRRMSSEREKCCDELAIAATGQRVTYAKALEKAAAIRLAPTASVLGAAFGGRKMAILDRVSHVLGMSVARKNEKARWWPVGLLALLMLVGIYRVAFETPLPIMAEEKAGQVELEDTHDEPAQEGKKAHGTDIAKPDTKKTVLVKGIVVDENGQPEGGVSVRALVPGEREPTVKSDTQGRFELQVDRKRANGLALAARSADGARQAFFKYKAGVPRPSARLTMRPARSIDVRVVDGKGKPVVVADVGAVVSHNDIAMELTNGQGEVTLRIPAVAPLQNIFALKSGLGLDYVAFDPKNEASVEHPLVLTLSGAKTVRVKLLDPEGRPMAGIGVCPWVFEKKSRRHREPWNGLNVAAVGIFQVKTNNDGVATFDWIPSWQTRHIAFWPRADKDIWVKKQIRVDLEDGKSEIKSQLVRTVAVRGQVRFANGQPAEDIPLTAMGAGYYWDKYEGSTRTDADGRFEFRVSPDLLYMFAVSDSKWAARARSGIVVRRDTPVNSIDFELFPATRVHGQVTMGADRKPLANEWVAIIQLGTKNFSLPEKDRLPIPANFNRRTWPVQPKISRGAITDENGHYEFHAGLGDYELRGPDYTLEQKFSLGKQKSRKIDLHVARPDRGIITGKVVLKGEDSRPVAEAEVVGVSMDGAGLNDLFTKTDKQGRFRTERRLNRMAFFAKSTDGKLAGIAKISADDKEVTIPVEPAATAKGRLFDAASRQPLPGRNIDYYVRINHLEPNGSRSGRWSPCFVGTVKTDAQGQFIVTGLLVGAEHEFSIVLRDKANPPGSYVYRRLTEVTPENTEVLELGNLVLALPGHAEKKAEQVEATDAKPEKPDTKASAKTFGGKVVDESGAIVVGADVWLSMGCKSRRYEWSVVHVKTDSQGRFTLKVPSAWVAEKFPNSPVIIWTYAPGYKIDIKHAKPRKALSFGPDESNLSIQLKPATDTTCMVLDPAGQPVADALIQPYYMTFQSTPEAVLRRIETRTDAAGRATLPAVVRKELEKVKIIAKGFGIQIQRYSDPEQPFQAENIIKLRPVGRIEGQLIADKPEWARGVWIRLTTEKLFDNTPPWAPEGFAEIESDDQGRFVVPAIANGRLNYRIVRVDEKLPVRPQLPRHIDVEADATTELRIPMVSLVPVRGSVRVKNSNTPVAGAKIDVRFGVQRDYCVSDSQGRFTAEVLPGRVGFFVSDMSGKHVQLGSAEYHDIRKEIELPPIELVPMKNVEGRVIDERGQPFTNARINIIYRNRIYGSSNSDTNGQFKLTGIPVTIDAAKAKYCIVQSSDPWRKELKNKVIKLHPLVIRVQIPQPTEPARSEKVVKPNTR